MLRVYVVCSGWSESNDTYVNMQSPAHNCTWLHMYCTLQCLWVWWSWHSLSFAHVVDVTFLAVTFLLVPLIPRYASCFHNLCSSRVNAALIKSKNIYTSNQVNPHFLLKITEKKCHLTKRRYGESTNSKQKSTNITFNGDDRTWIGTQLRLRPLLLPRVCVPKQQVIASLTPIHGW